MLLLTPLISLHFRSDFHIDLYTANDLFSFENELFFKTTIIFNIIAFVLFLRLELKEKIIYYGRVIFVLSSSILVFMVCHFSDNSFEVIIPMMMAHGTQYYLLSAKSENQLHNTNYKKIFISLFLLGLVGGGLDTYFQEFIDIDISYIFEKSYTLENITVALLLTPLFTHYIYDMKMWTSSYLHKVGK